MQSTKELVIIKIELTTTVDEYIKKYITEQSKETKDKIRTVIEERKVLEKLKNDVLEKQNSIDNLFTRLESSENGLPKEEVIKIMNESGVKSSSGITLKLKAMVKNKTVGKELIVTNERYIIRKMPVV